MNVTIRTDLCGGYNSDHLPIVVDFRSAPTTAPTEAGYTWPALTVVHSTPLHCFSHPPWAMKTSIKCWHTQTKSNQYPLSHIEWTSKPVAHPPSAHPSPSPSDFPTAQTAVPTRSPTDRPTQGDPTCAQTARDAGSPYAFRANGSVSQPITHFGVVRPRRQPYFTRGNCGL